MNARWHASDLLLAKWLFCACPQSLGKTVLQFFALGHCCIAQVSHCLPSLIYDWQHSSQAVQPRGAVLLHSNSRRVGQCRRSTTAWRPPKF